MSQPRIYARVYCDPCISRPTDPPAGYKILGAFFRQSAKCGGVLQPTIVAAAEQMAIGLTASLVLVAVAQQDEAEECVYSYFDPETDKWGEWK